MKLTKDGLSKVHQESTSRIARGGSDCPSSELLASAAVGQLAETERERVAEHIAGCSDCAEEYRLIAPLEDWAKRAARKPRETTGETKTMIELPAALPMEKSNVLRPIWRRDDKRSQSIAYAVAASFLFASILLGFWVVSLRSENKRIAAQVEKERIERENDLAASNQTLQETQRKLDESLRQTQPDIGKKEFEIAELRQRIDELSRPQFNVPIIDLEPRGSIRGEGAEVVKTVEIGAGANFFTIVLNVSGQPGFNDYLLEIQDASGKIISSGRGLRKSQYNTFTAALPSSLLVSGTYKLSLYGTGTGSKKLVQDYSMRVVKK